MFITSISKKTVLLKRSLFTVIILTFFVLSNKAKGQVSSQSEFLTIMSNIRNVQWMAGTEDVLSGKAILRLMLQQSEDGSWSDINYKSQSQTAWSPGNHLSRLHNMVLAYTYAKGNFYKNDNLRNSIENGLRYWYDADPRSSNWWNQQIFCPKKIGEILILLRSSQGISIDLEKKLLERMEKIGGDPEGPYSEGGSNRINIAAHWIYRGCLTSSLPTLEKGARNYLLPVSYCGPAQGLQRDLSYQEHRNQLYIGNYGYAFINNISEGALFLKNTPWALSGDQLDLFSDFVRRTYLNSIRGKYYSFSIPGRQVANKNALSRSNTIDLLERMVRVDSEHQQDYLAAKERWLGSKPADYKAPRVHNHFWISDYTVHNRENYNFDVRFVSSRTVRTENVNEENKKGHFLSDGATNMTIRGDEYNNIFPVWDWSKIPGTTTPLMEKLPDMPVHVGGLPGKADFCGGVSDSLYGVSTYTMDNSDFKIKARKSWFFFENEIVCLGTGISSTTSNVIGTTINQSLSRGKVQIKQDNAIRTIKDGTSGEATLKGLQWVLHDGFGYFFPTEGDIHVSNRQQSGSWKTISASQKDEIVTEKVFAIWLQHGTRPTNESYAYSIVPNMISTSQMDAYQKENPIRIISNTDSLQEVYNDKTGIREAVLFKKGIEIALDENYSIDFDQPCLLTMKYKVPQNKWELYVADPSQKLTEINAMLYDKTKGRTAKKFKISLPVSVLAGSTVKLNIEP